MDELDEIPWSSLHHAYGTAEDVPELLRALRTASGDLKGEASPLWHLFGNIWHQGTVYEATSYAVPFLIDLAANPETPDRVGVLNLLEAIAHGSSYLDVHQPFFEMSPIKGKIEPGTAKFEDAKSKELHWVRQAYRAVEAGSDTLIQLTDDSSDVAYAAASVLARLVTQVDVVAPILRRMHAGESRPLYRSGLLLLLSQLGDRSSATRSLISVAARSEEVTERRAAAIAAGQLDKSPFEGELRQAIIDAIVDADLHAHFYELPWDVSSNISEDDLLQRPADEVEQAAESILRLADQGLASDTQFWKLLSMLFPKSRELNTEPNGRRDLTPMQVKAVGAIVKAMDVDQVRLSFSMVSFGLPDSRRNLRNLASGMPLERINRRLPLLGSAFNPAKPLRTSDIRSGLRLHHRHFGWGRVASCEPQDRTMTMVVDFDSEGRKTLAIHDDWRRSLREQFHYALTRILSPD